MIMRTSVLVILMMILSFYTTALLANTADSAEVVMLSSLDEDKIKEMSPMVVAIADKLYVNNRGRVKSKWGYYSKKKNLYSHMDSMLKKTHQHDVAFYLGLAVGQYLRSQKGRRMLSNDDLLLRLQADLEETYSDAVDTTLYQKMGKSALAVGAGGAFVGFFLGGAFVSSAVVGGVGLVAGAVIAIPYNLVNDLMDSGSGTLNLVAIKDNIISKEATETVIP